MKRLTLLLALVAGLMGIVGVPSVLTAQDAMNPGLWQCNPSDCYSYVLVPPGGVLVNRMRANGVCYNAKLPRVEGAIQAAGCQNWVNIYMDGGASLGEPIADFVFVEGEAYADYMGGDFYMIEKSQDCDLENESIVPPPVSC